MRKSTRFALVAAAVAAAATPAFADSVTVNASPTASSRQLKVLDMAGQTLTSVSLNPGKGMPFQVQVVDSGFGNLVDGTLVNGNKFSVSASMNNLYRVSGGSYDYTTKIPSADLSIGYQANPIRAYFPTADVLGNVSITGTLPTCSGGVITGLTGLLTDVIASNPVTGSTLATQLCSELSSAVSVTTSAIPLQLPQTVDLSSLLPGDLPFQLPTTGESGAFTNADYSTGSIGAADGSKPGTWATNVTSKKLLTGQAGVTSSLATLLTSALNTSIGSLPLTSATGSGAVMSVSSAISAINALGGSLSTLAGTLTQIPAADASQLINTLGRTLGTPVLGDLSNVGQTSVSLPTLTYSGATTVPTGNYRGTMTVTLLSQ